MYVIHTSFYHKPIYKFRGRQLLVKRRMLHIHLLTLNSHLTIVQHDHGKRRMLQIRPFYRVHIACSDQSFCWQKDVSSRYAFLPSNHELFSGPLRVYLSVTPFCHKTADQFWKKAADTPLLSWKRKELRFREYDKWKERPLKPKKV